jgi:hypothetical protein
MSRYMNVNLLWVVPATAAIAAFWLVSAKANYEFGLSLGDPIFGYASLASDVTKTVALFGVFAAWASRYYVASAVLAVIWAACTLWSVASAVGFMSLHYATMTDQRGKSAEDYKLIAGQVARFEEQLSKVGSARPEAVVQAEIAGLLRTPGVNGCSTINGPVTQLICPKVDKLRAELGSSQSFAWLTGRIEEMRREMKTSDRVTSIDPRAETLAALAGITVQDTKKGMVAFFALLLEMVTAMGFWAFWRAFAGRSETPQEAPEAVAGATLPALSVVPPPAPAIRSERAPLAGTLEKLTGAKAPPPPMGEARGEGNLPEIPVSSAPEVFAGGRNNSPDPDGDGTPAPKPDIEPAEEPDDTRKVVNLFPNDSTPPEAPRGKKKGHKPEAKAAAWLADCCTQVEGQKAKSKLCWKSYQEYCQAYGKKELPRNAFSRQLAVLLGQRSGKDRPRNKGGSVFDGIVINETMMQAVAQKRRAA